MTTKRRVTPLVLALVWASVSHAALDDAKIEKMFPEQSPATLNTDPLVQTGLGIGELGAAAFLVAPRDPIERAIARVERKLMRVSDERDRVADELMKASTAYQREAIRVSLATGEFQHALKRAEDQFHYATLFVTEAEYQALSKKERAQRALLAKEYTSGSLLDVPLQITDRVPPPTSELDRYFVVSADVKESLRLASARKFEMAGVEMDQALLRFNGTREQIRLYPNVLNRSGLEAELDRVKSIEYGVVAEHRERFLKKELEKIENKVAELNGKIRQLVDSSPTLRAKIARFFLRAPVPTITSAIMVSDDVLRALIYLGSRDPGFSPLGKMFAEEVGLTK